MRARESGMPGEASWSEFFDAACIVEKLGCDSKCGDVVDFGCGYGIFTIAAARITRGTVHALDIDPGMIEATREKARKAGLENVRVEQRDFLARGSGRPDSSVGFAMLFNILHLDDPMALLGEAHRILAPGGRLAVIHWNYDPSTPRGPSLAIRPRPTQCRDWMEQAGFAVPGIEPLPCSPYHYGLVGERLPQARGHAA